MKENIQKSTDKISGEKLNSETCDGTSYSSEQDVSEIEKTDYKTEQVAIKETEKSVRKFLWHSIIHHDCIFTPLLIFINIIVFFLMITSGADITNPGGYYLITWGGNIRELTIGGQHWRLYTSVFLHSGILHLGLNIFALLQIGFLLEPVVGRGKFIFSYIATGIIASISSIIINVNVVSVGASGAIFGLYGVFIIMLLFDEISIPEEIRKKLLSSIGFFILFNLFNGFSHTGIDNAAHIGGLIGGLILGIIYSLIGINNKLHISVTYIIIICFIVYSVMSIGKIRNAFAAYTANIKLYLNIESKVDYTKGIHIIMSSDLDTLNSIVSKKQDLWQYSQLGNYNHFNKLKELDEGLRKEIDRFEEDEISNPIEWKNQFLIIQKNLKKNN